MKKLRILLFIMLFPLIGAAQFSSDLVIYNNYGDDFQVYINSSLVNNYPSNKVLITNLQSGNNAIKIIFNNSLIPSLNFIENIPSNTMVSASLEKDRDGRYFVNFFDAVYYVNSNNNYDPSPNGNGNNDNNNHHDHHGNHGDNDNYDNQNQPYHKGYCDIPMPENNFISVLTTIKDQTFDDNKLKLAKQIATVNCLTAMQVKQIMQLFTFESSKLDFAKFAYTRVWDVNNFYVVNSAFTFSTSIDELDEFISKVNQ